MTPQTHATRHTSALAMAIWLIILMVPGPAVPADWGAVARRDNRAIVLLDINWVDAEGPQFNTGTGFVVNGNYILTVAHHFPVGASETLTTGETEGLSSEYPRQSFTAKVVHLDRDADVAVLLPDPMQVTLTAVPTSWNWVPTELAGVVVRGFPLGGPLEGTPAAIRRSGISAEVPTDALLRAGHSGSPVYDETGTVVGMVRGGTPVADLEKDRSVMGLGFFVPLRLLQKANLPQPLFATIAAPAETTSTGQKSELLLSYTVNKTKTTELRTLWDLAKPSETSAFTEVITAEPGYRIVKYELIEHSANYVSDQEVKISPDGSSLEFRFKLTSGPGIDRTRGWLYATLKTSQQLTEKMHD